MGNYSDFCAVCGMAIASHEKGTAFQDIRVVDYHEHCEMIVSYHICHECWSKIKEHLDGGIDAAIERRERLEMYDVIGEERSRLK